MWPNPQFPVDLVIFTEEILNGKLHFLCSAIRLATNEKSWKFKIIFYTKQHTLQSTESDRERQRETERQREIETERQKDTERDRERQRVKRLR